MGWLNLDKKQSKSRRTPTTDAEVFSKRLVEILSSSSAVEDADPSEVEARIRNMTHGAGRE
jgi:hypothetical protein